MEATAFELRQEYAGTVEIEEDGETREVPVFAGATTTLANGQLYDLGAELEADEGVIVTSNPLVADALRVNPALRERSVPSEERLDRPYRRLRLEELRALPEAAEIEGADRMRKGDLVAALEAREQGQTPNPPAPPSAPAPAVERPEENEPEPPPVGTGEHASDAETGTEEA